MSGWLYMMTNRRTGTLYVGVTADLASRVWEHQVGGNQGIEWEQGDWMPFEGFGLMIAFTSSVQPIS
jgi:hypothetical protein